MENESIEKHIEGLKEESPTNNLWLKFLPVDKFDPKDYPDVAMRAKICAPMIEMIYKEDPELFEKLQNLTYQRFLRQMTKEWKESSEKQELDKKLIEAAKILEDNGFDRKDIAE